MSVAATIESKLRKTLLPTRLTVVDESELHKGHAGHRPGGESHFRVEIISMFFAGKSRVERQRRVYQILADELQSGVHALALTTLTPDEEIDRDVREGRLAPPWRRYPDIHRFSIGWRMGPGEHYYGRFVAWYEALGDDEAKTYARANPEFEEWEGFYDMVRLGVPPSEKVTKIAAEKARAAAERRKAERDKS